MVIGLQWWIADTLQDQRYHWNHWQTRNMKAYLRTRRSLKNKPGSLGIWISSWLHAHSFRPPSSPFSVRRYLFAKKRNAMNERKRISHQKEEADECSMELHAPSQTHRHDSTWFNMFHSCACSSESLQQWVNTAVWLWEFEFTFIFPSTLRQVQASQDGQTGHAAGVHTVPIAWFDPQVLCRSLQIAQMCRFVGYVSEMCRHVLTSGSHFCVPSSVQWTASSAKAFSLC